MNGIEDLYAAVTEGAVHRIRPKIMTVSAIIFGLLPIMWSPVYQAGADVMKRIATPMIGGVITSAILELLIYPAIYVIWRRRSLPAEPVAGHPVDMLGTTEPRSRRRMLTSATAVVIIGSIIAGGFIFGSSWIQNSAFASTDPKMPVAKVTQDGVTISILSSDGEIHAKDNALKLVFQHSAGHPVEAENLKLELNMNMPGMVVHTGAQIKRDSGMGDFHAQLTPNMTGDWTVDLSYRGPQGRASVTVPVNVKH